ncbi:hypothetical protein [Mesorhizobium sp. NBSH29]|uniref:hypothetical protein n=1 Tax=Mesorhizobium sp. NBSH29 TaxID=2654249 RepID=UPI00189640BD|nr:hypothetical protein [Mesorhizobium sp. NBSH29]
MTQDERYHAIKMLEIALVVAYHATLQAKAIKLRDAPLYAEVALSWLEGEDLKS